MGSVRRKTLRTETSLESLEESPLEAEWIRERILRDCITIRPAMMALVVAIAGMILPAISTVGINIFFPHVR